MALSAKISSAKSAVRPRAASRKAVRVAATAGRPLW